MLLRADQLVLQRGLAPTRSAARRLIASGALRWRPPSTRAAWAVSRKAGEPLPDDCELELVDDAEVRFVSRGGLKLEGALERIGLDVAGAVCLDVGQGTGGFTDALLACGAARVVGVDVGHGQLAEPLRGDDRVVCIEGVNARALEPGDLPDDRYDLVVADLSFISLALVLPAIAPLAARDLVLLVKPQFELQPADIGKGGLVRDPAAATPVVEAKLRAAAEAAGLLVRDWFPSPIAGGDGNAEHFLHCQVRDRAPKLASLAAPRGGASAASGGRAPPT